MSAGHEALRARIEALPTWPPYSDSPTMTMDRYVKVSDVLAALSAPLPVSDDDADTGRAAALSTTPDLDAKS